MSRFVDIECTAVTEVINRRKFEDREDIQEFLDNIPTADVVEVKYGYWEIVKGSNGKEKMVCTNCRLQQDLHSTFTYCPNCGALIDGRVIHNG